MGVGIGGEGEGSASSAAREWWRRRHFFPVEGGPNPRGKGGWRDSEFFGATCEKQGENRRGRVKESEERVRENHRENGEVCLIWIIPIFICDDTSSLITLIVVANNFETTSSS
ncbi:hypothetical protein TIFTF001_034910 [Ficus carica]|uniref:Uncharacterized protein n=1 Tax=Ficus carica TaxID=3494 RepID=A0AA88J984_FICCA|nr:hypothetical protein TIFTF001_034910 [Ficus carica]